MIIRKIQLLFRESFRKQFSDNRSACLAVIIQIIFSHEMLSEVDRADN